MANVAQNRYFITGLIFLNICLVEFVCLPICRAGLSEPDEAKLRREDVEQKEKFWKNLASAKAEGNYSCRAVIGYALVLGEAREHSDRLARLFDILAEMQDRHAESETYGNFKWTARDSGVSDLNAIEFCMHDALLLWLRHRDWMPRDSQRQLKAILQYGAEGCYRHRVDPSYTNISLHNAGNLLLLGSVLGHPEKTAEGIRRLDAVVNWTAAHGIHEFCSPTYYGIDLNALMLIATQVQDEHPRRQAENLLRLIWADIALNWFPAAERMGCCNSRTSDFLCGRGALDWYLWVNGWFHRPTPGKAERFEPYWRQWTPPEQLRKISTARLPRLVRQSWGERQEQSLTCMLYPDITLSSIGAGYSSQDIPLLVDLPGSRDAPRCYFIADGREDPYGMKKFKAGPEAHSKALHLNPFWIGAQRTSDALGLAIYRRGDLKSIPASQLQSHFVMRRDAQSLWIQGRRVSIPPAKETYSIAVKTGDALVLRYGTAALGVRVLAATTSSGAPAKVSLVDDGNSYGCIRLTVDHGVPEPQRAQSISFPLAAAGFWARVGSGLNDDAAFTAWREAFQSARPAIQAKNGSFQMEAPGVDGSVVIAVQATESRCKAQRIVPEPCRKVLELDGEEIGIPLLNGAATIGH